MLKHIVYITYDTDDIIGKCRTCPGDLIEAPELSHDLDLSEEDRRDFEVGFWQIAYCPVCGTVEIIIPPTVE